MIECTWERIGDKNVKLCRSLVKEIKYKFKGNKIIVEIEYYDSKTGEYVEYSAKQYQSIPIPKNFIGRKEILEKLAKTNASIVIVWGLPGTGKTFLIAKYVNELNKPIFWYNVSEFSSLRHFVLRLSLLLDTYGYRELAESLKSSIDPLFISETLLNAVEKSELVIVVDDYHKIEDRDLLKILRYLVDHINRSKMIIISRIRPTDLLKVGKVLEIKLGGLSFRETIEFIKNRKEKLSNKELVELYIATQGIPVLLQIYCELKRIEPNISILIFRRKNILSYIINEIYNHLSDEEKKLFNILISIDEPIELEAIKTIYEFRELRKTLRKFIERGLVEETTDNKYIIHSVFRILYKRLSDTIIKHIYSSIGRYYLEKNNPLNFLRALTYFYRAQDHKGITDLLEKRIFKDLDYHTYYMDKYKMILEEIGKWDITNLRLKMYLDYEIGHLSLLMGDLEKAVKKISNALWLLETPRNESELFLKIQMLTDLAEAYSYLGFFDKAWKYIEEAEETAIDIRSDEIRKFALFHINGSKGLYYYFLGKIDMAINAYVERLSYAKDLDDPKYYFHNCPGLANLYELNKEYDKALKILNVALEYSIKTKNKYLEALIRMIMGVTYYKMGKYNEADKNICETITVYERAGIKMRLADSYVLKSFIEFKRGNYEKALKYARKSYEIYKITRTCDKGNAIACIIASLTKLNRYEEANKVLKENIDLLKECMDQLEAKPLLEEAGVDLTKI